MSWWKRKPNDEEVKIYMTDQEIKDDESRFFVRVSKKGRREYIEFLAEKWDAGNSISYNLTNLQPCILSALNDALIRITKLENKQSKEDKT